MNKKVILVTGGAGFIGSNLCKRLISENHKVICIDNLYSGLKKNIEPLLSNSNFTFIEHDIIFPLDNLNLKCDEIFNLACPASPKFYQKDPIFTLKTNVIGVMNMLDFARKNNAIILQASTSEVYGNPTQTPQKENYFGNVNPNGIRSCYDEGKRVAECLCFDYHRIYGTKIKIARIFNCYGPNMRIDDGRVISTFINQALTEKNITIFGDGKQTRSFCYIDDLMDGLEKLITSKTEIIGPVNLGNPQEICIKQTAEIIKKLTNSKSSFEYLPLPQDDPLSRNPDISYAKKIINFNPKINLETGLLKTIKTML